MAKDFPKRSENYSEWYNELVVRADLAEQSAVRGCMVIKPYGYAIWEKMQHQLDKMFKETGHQNAYFPLFIPKSFLSREAEHVEGFAKECAVVTHHRLMNDPNGKGVVVDPAAKLEEELIVRPTSETIIWSTYKNWIKSYRDLPILCNQWANVVRWEMRTRMFLRTAEFLWQEGHTAHATREEAEAETRRMLDVYAEFAEKYMAVPVLKGHKSPNERFAGALDTLCIEAMMQDGKALQAGTSHFLGQNFAKAFEVQFLNKENKLEYVWATSWGVSTRLMGALIMTHSDDNGLVLPPHLAPIHVAIVPICKSDEQQRQLDEHIAPIVKALEAKGLVVKYDNRPEYKPGWKFNEQEMRGIPLRIEIGPKDIENGQCVIASRWNGEKVIVPLDKLEETVYAKLEEAREGMYNKALENMNNRTYSCETIDEINKALEEKGDGFIKAMWCGDEACEDEVKEKTGVGSRCIPFMQERKAGNCVCCGKPADKYVIWGRQY